MKMDDCNTSMIERSEALKRHRLLFFVTLIAIIVYLVWRTVFTIPTKFGLIPLIFGILLLLSEMMASFEAIVNYSMLSKNIPLELPEIPEEWYPDIDIFITTHNEPVDLLYTTVNACTFLQYPDKSKVHVHLCDDTNRPEMAELARSLGVHYFGLSDNKDAKGGNINNAARQTTAPIVITLDADMIPQSEFLLKSVPYFFLHKMKKDENGHWQERREDEIDPDLKIGFIQTPQGFYNPDLFQYNLFSETRIPSEQDLFFREINVARSACNAPIYAGSNTLISREALAEVGYIAIDTITEDLLTGLRIQKAGYRCYATPEVLVQGQSPITVKSLIKQRERWGRGCIDALRQEEIIFSDQLTISQKLCYIGCWVYWWAFLRRAIFLSAPILAILFNIHVVEASAWQVLVFWLPYYLLFNRSLRVMSGDVWNQHWSNVADTILFPYLIGPILAEQLGIKQKRFSVTDKAVRESKSRETFIYSLPHMLFLIGILASIVSVIAQSIRSGSFYSPIILFWLIIGCKNLLFAIFFCWGRDNFRLEARFYFSEPMEVHYNGRILKGMTKDASRTGLSFSLDTPEYFPLDESIAIVLSHKSYQVTVTGKVVHVGMVNGKWKYSILLDELAEQTKRIYFQIVFDREHSLPKMLDPQLSILDDFNLQLGKRVETPQDSMRKLPRIRLNIPFTDIDGSTSELVDFNYQYVTVIRNDTISTHHIYDLKVGSYIKLTLESAKTDTGITNLYRIIENDDYKRFLKTAETGQLLNQLSQLSEAEKARLEAYAIPPGTLRQKKSCSNPL